MTYDQWIQARQKPGLSGDEVRKVDDDYNKILAESHKTYMDTSKPLEERKAAFSIYQGGDTEINTANNESLLQGENAKRAAMGVPALDLTGEDPFEHNRLITEGRRQTMGMEQFDLVKGLFTSAFKEGGQEGYNAAVAKYQPTFTDPKIEQVMGELGQGDFFNRVLKDTAPAQAPLDPTATPGVGSSVLTPAGSNTHGNLNLTAQTKARRKAIGDVTPTLLNLNQPSKSLLGL